MQRCEDKFKKQREVAGKAEAVAAVGGWLLAERKGKENEEKRFIRSDSVS